MLSAGFATNGHLIPVEPPGYPAGNWNNDILLHTTMAHSKTAKNEHNKDYYHQGFSIESVEVIY